MRGNFTGNRGGQSSTAKFAKELRRMEIQRGGKLLMTSTQRYKWIMQKRISEQQDKGMRSAYSTFSLNGAKPGEQKMSRKAEQALKEIAQKKAAKEAKEMRQMVVIQPRRYGDVGRINEKGIVYDYGNNMTLKVDAKTGKIKTMGGFSVGKYKPNSKFHNAFMQQWIKKYSPYQMQLAKLQIQKQMMQLQQLQQQAQLQMDQALIQQQIQMLQQQMVDMQSAAPTMDAHGNMVYQPGQRNNMGVSAWGVMSNNVHGTFAENVHGGFAENVWGTTSNNIWGGIGEVGGMWGSQPRRRRFGGYAGGKNYIGMWIGMALSRMGFGRNRRPAGVTGRVTAGPGAVGRR